MNVLKTVKIDQRNQLPPAPIFEDGKLYVAVETGSYTNEFAMTETPYRTVVIPVDLVEAQMGRRVVVRENLRTITLLVPEMPEFQDFQPTRADTQNQTPWHDPEGYSYNSRPWWARFLYVLDSSDAEQQAAVVTEVIFRRKGQETQFPLAAGERTFDLTNCSEEIHFEWMSQPRKGAYRLVLMSPTIYLKTDANLESALATPGFNGFVAVTRRSGMMGGYVGAIYSVGNTRCKFVSIGR